MIKIRITLFLLTIAIVGTLAYFASLYARGYVFDPATLKFNQNGILVIDSEPKGAQIFINGEFKTVTNATIPLPPGEYDVSVKKEGLLTWNKRLIIKNEVVTQAEVLLFPTAASLSPLTYFGAMNPKIAPDMTKLAYAVPVSRENQDRSGLWVTESTTLPIGFNREPRRITDGELKSATWEWSPDSQEILLTTATGTFLLDVSKYTPQSQRVNVSSQKNQILADWKTEEEKRTEGKLSKLPAELKDTFLENAVDIELSPDENKILYTASSSATIREELVKELPGSSTQKQEREIKIGSKYVYDIKEDRNFRITDVNQVVFWLPSSNHLILPQESKVIIMDYDGTNQQIVYSGAYLHPHAYPYSNKSSIIILTSLGADSTPNLYSLSLK